MYTSATLLTIGSIIIGIATVLAVLLVLVTMSYRKRRMQAEDATEELGTTDGDDIESSSHNA